MMARKMKDTDSEEEVRARRNAAALAAPQRAALAPRCVRPDPGGLQGVRQGRQR
eukprot:CAMPEP_0198429912 /NCGR_PEP_ID=MMETSP1452-20131203/10471_1 /TAXON_ID=1181717 /ORGANISM="Synchroma pusillum, Strain CCMP3072" /LENGTH=53 /DNA_ID=CAMNT_0044150335 /DNA_START=1 /DNA_END=158 /DNA_ORIENTATION=+